MKLISLKLENIKSYKEETIDFKEGINCILGLNGSGKSTIIESIGFTLFNYTNKTANELLRYNENKGTITLTFEAADDKIYTIVRTIRKKSNTVKLVDEGTGNIILENVSDVYSFVKKSLNIPKDKSMAKLFEEIIAVPQGSFVNAFLETSKVRKESFDKLFDLDIYKKLADDTKKVTDTIEKEYIQDLEKQIAHLEGLLSGYDNKVLEYNEISARLENNQKEYNDLLVSKLHQEKQISKLESKKEQLEAKTKTINNINEQINITNTNIVNNNEQIDNYKQAEQVLQDNEYGYRMYINSKQKASELDEKIAELKKINEDFNDNKINIQLNDQEIKHLEALIYENKVTLGKNKDQLNKLLDTITENKTNINNLEIQIKELNDKILAEDNRNNNIIYQNRINVSELEEAEKKVISTEQFDTLLIEKNIVEINEKLSEIKRLSAIVNENDKAISKLQQEKVELENNLICMSDGLCPILKQKCMNLKHNNLHDELLIRIKACDVEIQALTLSSNEKMPKINQEEQLNKDKTAYEINLLLANKNKEDINKTIENVRLRYGVEVNDENYIEVIRDLKCKYQKINDEYQNDLLEEMKDNLQELISKKTTSLAQIKISIDVKNKIQEACENLQKIILQKSNELNILKEKNTTLQTINKELDIEIDKYKNVEIEMMECKAVMNKFVDHFTIYIKNEDICKRKEDIFLKKHNLEEELQKLNTELKALEKDIAMVKNEYSDDEHHQANQLLQATKERIFGLEATINLQKQEKDKRNQELEFLHQKKNEYLEIENKMAIYQKLREKYKKMRNIFANIPKELSEQFRKYISIYASSIYYLISNESVRIAMLDDYEVILIDLNDETKVKTMKQLSGGEQMSVAIAIRLAMLKQITKIDFYFMDEPTINLDYERRIKLGDVVKDMSKELKQLFVISHDDTFDNITNNTIKVTKIQNSSKLEN